VNSRRNSIYKRGIIRTHDRQSRFRDQFQRVTPAQPNLDHLISGSRSLVDFEKLENNQLNQ